MKAGDLLAASLVGISTLLLLVSESRAISMTRSDEPSIDHARTLEDIDGWGGGENSQTAVITQFTCSGGSCLPDIVGPKTKATRCDGSITCNSGQRCRCICPTQENPNPAHHECT